MKRERVLVIVEKELNDDMQVVAEQCGKVVAKELMEKLPGCLIYVPHGCKHPE